MNLNDDQRLLKGQFHQALYFTAWAMVIGLSLALILFASAS